MKHLIIDAETMSTREFAMVLELSAVIVDQLDSRPILQLPTFRVKFKASAQTNRHVDPNTVAWWKQQDPAVQQAVLRPSAEDVDPEEGLEAFVRWLEQNKFDKRYDLVWQRGDRDWAWIHSLLLDCGWTDDQKFLPIAWNRIRDLRTAVDVSGISSKINGYPDNVEELKSRIPGFKKHDSLCDVLLEVLILREAGVLSSPEECAPVL